MESTINIDAYSDALVILGTAGILVPIFRRLKVSSILAYLAAGAVLGPFGLGSYSGQLRFLYWFTITDAGNVEGLAELGIVFLFFLIGLELSFQRLIAMRRLVLGLGVLQVALTSLVIGAIAAAVGQSPSSAAVIGATLSLSSTAIVLDLLSSQGRLTTTTGRASFSVLLAQDVAVIPILIFISIVGAHSEGSVLTNMGRALLQAAIALAIIAIVGRLVLRPLFGSVASTRSRELFIAAVLFVIVAAAVTAYVAGLSMALGAFVAGLLLAETEYHKAIETAVEPFKGLLLGIFFFSVGMNIDFHELLSHPLELVAAVAALICVKAGLIAPLARLFRLPWSSAVETGLLLSPGGEFAFVGVSLASSLGFIAPGAAGFVLAAVAISMTLTPLLAGIGQRYGARRTEPAGESLTAPTSVPSSRYAIVVGFGRVGRVVCSLLKQHDVPYIAIDRDADNVTGQRKAGEHIYYGNAANPGFLQAVGVGDATGMVITIDDHNAIDRIVSNARSLRPDLVIVSRGRDRDHAKHLYSMGATDVVPETIEASLQLSEAALVRLGVPTGPAIASIHGKRDEFRDELQRGAAASGRQARYGVAAKKGAGAGDVP